MSNRYFSFIQAEYTIRIVLSAYETLYADLLSMYTVQYSCSCYNQKILRININDIFELVIVFHIKKPKKCS